MAELLPAPPSEAARVPTSTILLACTALATAQLVGPAVAFLERLPQEQLLSTELRSAVDRRVQEAVCAHTWFAHSPHARSIRSQLLRVVALLSGRCAALAAFKGEVEAHMPALTGGRCTQLPAPLNEEQRWDKLKSALAHLFRVDVQSVTHRQLQLLCAVMDDNSLQLRAAHVPTVVSASAVAELDIDRMYHSLLTVWLRQFVLNTHVRTDERGRPVLPAGVFVPTLALQRTLGLLTSDPRLAAHGRELIELIFALASMSYESTGDGRTTTVQQNVGIQVNRMVDVERILELLASLPPQLPLPLHIFQQWLPTKLVYSLADLHSFLLRRLVVEQVNAQAKKVVLLMPDDPEGGADDGAHAMTEAEAQLLDRLVDLHWPVAQLASLVCAALTMSSSKGPSLDTAARAELLFAFCRAAVIYTADGSQVAQPILDALRSAKQLRDWLLQAQQLLVQPLLDSADGPSRRELSVVQLWSLHSHLNRAAGAQLPLQWVELLHNGSLSETGTHLSLFAPDAYQGTRVQAWDRGAIRRWAARVRVRALEDKVSLGDLDTQKELLAVVNRAFGLFSGTKQKQTMQLRHVQLLAILSLLPANTSTPQPLNAAPTLAAQQNPVKSVARLAQVATGEGKSMVIAALAVLFALMGKQVDVITSSSVLARRDAKSFEGFYDMFALSVAACDTGEYVQGAKACYRCHVLYGNASEFQYDYLRDEFSLLGTRAGRQYNMAIVDEADSMMLDEGAKIAMLADEMPSLDHLLPYYLAIWNYVQQLHRVFVHIDELPNHLPSTLPYQPEKWCTCPVLAQQLVQWYADELQHRRQSDDMAVQADRQDLYFDVVRRQVHKVMMQDEISGLARPISEPHPHHRGHRASLHSLWQTVKDTTDSATRLATGRTPRARSAAAAASRPAESALKCPIHMRDLVRCQLPRWVNSAVIALLHLDKYKQYVVREDAAGREVIAPVDFSNTGVTQLNSQWADGLHQFLQLKEGLELTPESLQSNYLSNIAYFNRYEGCVGLTGTLGSAQSRALLAEQYQLEFVDIPRYKKRHFQQIASELCRSTEQWLDSIAQSVALELAKRRAVLIICQTIADVDRVHDHLVLRKAVGNRVLLCQRSDLVNNPVTEYSPGRDGRADRHQPRRARYGHPAVTGGSAPGWHARVSHLPAQQPEGGGAGSGARWSQRGAGHWADHRSLGRPVRRTGRGERGCEHGAAASHARPARVTEVAPVQAGGAAASQMPRRHLQTVLRAAQGRQAAAAHKGTEGQRAGHQEGGARPSLADRAVGALAQAAQRAVDGRADGAGDGEAPGCSLRGRDGGRRSGSLRLAGPQPRLPPAVRQRSGPAAAAEPSVHQHLAAEASQGDVHAHHRPAVPPTGRHAECVR